MREVISLNGKPRNAHAAEAPQCQQTVELTRGREQWARLAVKSQIHAGR